MPHLTDTLIATHGVATGWRFGLEFDVRWSELDAFRHVNHRTHLGWFEEVRNAMFLELNYPPFALDGAGPVIRELTVGYDKPIGIATRILTTGKFVWLKNSSFRMEFAVWHRGQAASSHAICVWLRNSSGEKVILPDSLRERIHRLYEAEDLR